MNVSNKKSHLNFNLINRLKETNPNIFTVDDQNDHNKKDIIILWKQNGKELFRVVVHSYVNKDQVDIISIQYFMNMHVSLVDEMIRSLELYRDFANRTIEVLDINSRYKLFGDIIQGKFTKSTYRENDIASALDYWNNVKEVEGFFHVQFDITSPMSESDSEDLSTLVISLVKERPCRVKKIDNLVITTEKGTLDKLLNKGNTQGVFTTKLDASNEKICGTTLKGCYKVLYYGPVTIKGHTDDKVLDNNKIRTKLVLQDYDNTISAIMYFRSKDKADKFMNNKENLKLFKNAKYSWEYK